MKSFHTYVNGIAAGGPPGATTSSNWNDVHQTGSVPTPYNTNGVVPTSVDLIRATGGSGGIALALTPGTAVFTGPSGVFSIYQTYYAMKVDAGAGVITFTDLNGALLNGASSYVLENQWQWAIFCWNGTSWDAFGN